MTSNDALQAHFKNERELFLNILNSVIILDIGVINSITPEGRANVTSSTFVGNKPIKYADAEIIYPGNTNGCYVSRCSGMACLIFIPKSCMPNIDDLKIRIGATSYNRDGVKVMPIGNGFDNKVQCFFSSSGEYSIIGQTYNLQFDESSASFQRKDGKTSITVDGTGQIYLSRQTNTGTYNINIEDTGVTKTWLSQNKDVLWTDTYNPDGSRSFIQTNPNDEDADPLFSMTIANDGVVSFNVTSGVSLITKDTLTLKGKSVVVEATDGTIGITASKDQEVNAGAITVTTNNNKTFSVNGDNLVVEK